MQPFYIKLSMIIIIDILYLYLIIAAKRVTEIVDNNGRHITRSVKLFKFQLS